ncbi:MAG: hypothetical protein J6T26_07775 [Firmicutes bacterium]|nr:hypothetical protein [Bacillota bacterium]
MSGFVCLSRRLYERDEAEPTWVNIDAITTVAADREGRGTRITLVSGFLLAVEDTEAVMDIIGRTLEGAK